MHPYKFWLYHLKTNNIWDWKSNLASPTKKLNICKSSEPSIGPIITLQMKLCLSESHLGYVIEKKPSLKEMQILVITFRLFKSHLGPTNEMETSTNQIQVLVIVTFSFFI